MDLLITFLIWAIVFAILAFSMAWVCGKFFPEWPPARWICGGILLIILLVALRAEFPAGLPHFR